MKYCSGKYHGDVKKQIEDNEDYCIICRGIIANEKAEKKEKSKKLLKKIGIVAAVVLEVGLTVVGLAKKSDKS